MYDSRSFPHILANVDDIQKKHVLLHRPVLNPGYPLRECLLEFIDCCLYICIYVSVTKQACPAFSAWLNAGSIRPLKVTGKAIMLWSMALPSKLFASLHGQSNVCSMCDCKSCRNSDLSVWVKILSGVDSNHGTCPRRNGSVNSRSTSCLIETSC